MCVKLAEETEGMEKSEVRQMRRIRYYIEECINDDDKSISDIQSAVQVITNGLALKTDNPDNFQGYKPEIEKRTNLVGIQVHSRST